jgi:hypothetical protein
MKLNIYCDPQGVFKYVPELPENNCVHCPREWFATDNDYEEHYKGFIACGNEHQEKLEKIKSSSIRFKDQELVARFIAEQKPKQLNKWALAIESLSSIIFHSDTFYSIELEGYEVGFGIRCDADCMGMCGECSKGEKVAILKPVASQKDSPSKEEPVKKSFEDFKNDVARNYGYESYYSDMSAGITERCLHDAAELYAGSKEEELQKEIDRLNACILNSDTFAAYEKAVQSNKELLEALKAVMGMWQIANKAHYERNSDARIKFTTLIHKHSNPPSTVNQEPDYSLDDIINKNPEYVHPSKEEESSGVIDCPNCRRAWNTTLFNACECGASITRKEQI